MAHRCPRHQAAASVTGAVARKSDVSDVIVIPAGVPHQWAVDSNMKYTVVRVDPDILLAAGYVNPGLKKFALSTALMTRRIR